MKPVRPSDIDPKLWLVGLSVFAYLSSYLNMATEYPNPRMLVVGMVTLGAAVVALAGRIFGTETFERYLKMPWWVYGVMYFGIEIGIFSAARFDFYPESLPAIAIAAILLVPPLYYQK